MKSIDVVAGQKLVPSLSPNKQRLRTEDKNHYHASLKTIWQWFCRFCS